VAPFPVAVANDEVDPATTPPRRIAFVITRADAGGAQMHVLYLARALRAAGHAVAVFVGSEGPFIDDLHEAGVPVWPLKHLVWELSVEHDTRATWELRAALAAFRPDLVSCHATKGGWWGRIAARSLGVPAVHTSHGQLFSLPLKGVQRGLWLPEFITNRVGTKLIVVCKHDAETLIEYRVVSPQRMVLVYNGVPDIDPTLRAYAGREAPHVVMTARLQAPKDPLTVIGAFARLRDEPWTLELIGDGPLRPEVEAAVAASGMSDRIQLSGTCLDVPERLARAQVFLLSTYKEGFPISILEAMRARLPVVAARVGGIPEAVEPGVTGALFEARSPEALADAIRPLLRDPEFRRRQGEAGRERYLSEFGIERHLRLIWGVYLQAMRRRFRVPTGSPRGRERR
jgi:glycosyltransferase involved in cell wall biosynthesis